MQIKMILKRHALKAGLMAGLLLMVSFFRRRFTRKIKSSSKKLTLH